MSASVYVKNDYTLNFSAWSFIGRLCLLTPDAIDPPVSLYNTLYLTTAETYRGPMEW